MDKGLSQLQYVRDVLGVQNFLKPSSLRYHLYGSLDSYCLLFFCEPYEAENKKLLQRMMKALRISSYGCVHSLKPLHEPSLKSLILRSSARRVCFFGQEWKSFLKKELNCEWSVNEIKTSWVRVVLTYSLREFIGKSSEVRQKKLQTFQVLKNF